VAEKLCRAVRENPWPHRRVTASFGVATILAGTVDSIALLLEADQALYDSKRRGRDRVTHFKECAVSARGASWLRTRRMIQPA
jgi:GGDEF domain-containing protein